jgi:predicted transposase YdaD
MPIIVSIIGFYSVVVERIIKKRKEERGKERERKRKRREKEREEKEEKRTELALSSSALQIDMIPRTPRSNKLCKTTAAKRSNQ